MTDKPIIWTEPLELVCDGTPVVFANPDKPKDNWGEYALVREDGKCFTEEQHPRGEDMTMIVTPSGRHWTSGPDDPALVRNRVQMDDAKVDELVHASMSKDFERRETLENSIPDHVASFLYALVAPGQDANSIISQNQDRAREAHRWLYERKPQRLSYDAMMAERDKGEEV